MSHRSSLQLPPLEIEYKASRQQSSLLLDDLTKNWEALGRDHAHWSVLTEQRFLPGGIDIDSFYKTGSDDLDWIDLTLRRNGLELNDFKSVVEYGCGVGRVTYHLAQRCQVVTGIDISDPHLELARSRVASASFTKASSPDFGMVNTFDFWFSRIVLQHSPPPIIHMILERMFWLLAPRGVALFQIPTHGPRPFILEQHLEDIKWRPEGCMDMFCLPQRAIFEIANRFGCVPLEVREDNSTGSSDWVSNVFLFQKP